MDIVNHLRYATLNTGTLLYWNRLQKQKFKSLKACSLSYTRESQSETILSFILFCYLVFLVLNEILLKVFKVNYMILYRNMLI